jgi:hypothetical protein
MFIILFRRKSRNFLASLTRLDVNTACGYSDIQAVLNFVPRTMKHVRSDFRYRSTNFIVTIAIKAITSE